jgi:hypothetical protein
MNKTEIILLILFTRMGSADILETYCKIEKFNEKYSEFLKMNVENWLNIQEWNQKQDIAYFKKSKFLHRDPDHMFKALWDPDAKGIGKYVVVKREKMDTNSHRFKRLENEIVFYEKMKGNEFITQHTPRYYGCLSYSGKVYLVLEFFENTFQKFNNLCKNRNNLPGFKIYDNSYGNDQMEFLTEIGEVIEKIHLEGIALTNINAKNILIKKTEKGISPVLTSFGRHKYVSRESIPIDQDQSERERYEEFLVRDVEDQHLEEYRLSPDNLKKSDILGFANLLYRSGVQSWSPTGIPPKERFSKFKESFLMDELLDKRKYITCANQNKNLYKDLMTEMTKQWAEIEINFTDIVKRLKGINCPDEEEGKEKKESPLDQKKPARKRRHKKKKRVMRKRKKLDSQSPPNQQHETTKTKIIEKEKINCPKIYYNNNVTKGCRTTNLRSGRGTDDYLIINIDAENVEEYHEYGNKEKNAKMEEEDQSDRMINENRGNPTGNSGLLELDGKERKPRPLIVI